MKKWIFISLLLVTAVGCYKGKGLSGPGNESGVQGRITFLGAWPDTTREVWVVALKQYPHGITETDSLIDFVADALFSGDLAYSDPITPGSETANYRLLLDPDIWEWILVVWFPDIEEYFFGVKELGAYYKDTETDTLPTPVNVRSQVMMEGIDIIADFENVKRDKPFFKTRRAP